ncbi:MAG: aerotaxis receptor Aer [Micrococcales bacterium]|nr:MAG: aerotaxis receptor Aer [Micrococcales bacterium]
MSKAALLPADRRKVAVVAAVAVRPTGRERTFGAEEIIVSKTDPKGRITYANDVFVRVSKYSLNELIGSPHSLIRHPKMPRGIFHLLWQTILSKQEIFAYVNNLAADGANYWVLAHVTPTYGNSGQIISFHSNRRLPAPGAVRTISTVYEEMLAWEQNQQGRPAQIAEQSAQRLTHRLAEQSMTYEEYVWSLISAGA